jgi:hypothetical protein
VPGLGYGFENMTRYCLGLNELKQFKLGCVHVSSDSHFILITRGFGKTGVNSQKSLFRPDGA